MVLVFYSFPPSETNDEIQKPKFQQQVLIERIIDLIGENSWGVFQEMSYHFFAEMAVSPGRDC
jgi:hypothetical protein